MDTILICSLFSCRQTKKILLCCLLCGCLCVSCVTPPTLFKTISTSRHLVKLGFYRARRAPHSLCLFFFFSLVCMWWRAQAPLNLNFQKFSFPSSFPMIVLSRYWLAWIDWYFRVARPRDTWLSRMCNIWCSYQLQRARYTLKLRGKKGTKNKPPSSTSLLALVCVCARVARYSLSLRLLHTFSLLIQMSVYAWYRGCIINTLNVEKTSTNGEFMKHPNVIKRDHFEEPFKQRK